MANLHTTCGNEGRLREYYAWGVFVRGKRIKRVVFFLDGEKIARVTKADAQRRFGTRIDRRTLGDGDHKLQAKVFFFKTKKTYLLSLKLPAGDLRC